MIVISNILISHFIQVVAESERVELGSITGNGFQDAKVQLYFNTL